LRIIFEVDKSIKGHENISTMAVLRQDFDEAWSRAWE
jgi:hypothetical protein